MFRERVWHVTKIVRRHRLHLLALGIAALIGLATPALYRGVSSVRAATCNATSTGLWSAGATWTGCTGTNGVPSSGDSIIINAGVTVTLDTPATVAGLAFAGGTSPAILTHDSSNPSLTVNGTVTINQPTAAASNAWNINDGSATVSGLITYAGSTNDATLIGKIVTTTGTLNANGGITFIASNSASKVLDMSGGAGTLNLKGALTIPANSATFTLGGTSSFNYADSIAQTVVFPSSGAYNHLLFNNGSATGATLGAAVTAANVTGTLTVQSGIFRNGGFAIAGNAGAAFEVFNSAEFQMSGASSVFPSGFGTYTLQQSSTESYLQSGATVIAAQTYGNLNAKPSANSITFTFAAGTTHVQGNLVTGNGTNTAASINANTNSPTLDVDGNVTNSANTTLVAPATNPFTVGGSWSNSGTFTSSSGTVTFDSTSSGRTLAAGSSSFGKCVFAGTGGVWTTQTNSFNCTSTLTITTGELDFGAVATTITGTTLVDTAGTLKFTSSAGTKTFTGAVTINSGGTWTSSAAGSAIFGGGITNNGASFLQSGGVTFNATQSLAGSSPMIFGSTFAISGAITLTNTNAAGVTINGAVSGSLGTSTLTNATNALIRFGSVVLSTGNGGVLNASATGNTVVYSGSSSQTAKIPSGSPATYYNLGIESNGSFVNLSAPITIANNLTVTSGSFNDGGFQVTGPGSSSGTLSILAGANLCLGAAAPTCSAATTSATTLPLFQTYTFAPTSTVRYTANANQTISSTPAYGNLVFSPTLTSPHTYSFTSGAVTVNGNFTITPSAASILLLTVTMAGDITIPASKSLTFTNVSSASSTLVTHPGSTDYNITTGGLSIGARASIDASSSASTITVAGNYTDNGSFIAGNSTFVLNGTSSQTLIGNMVNTTAFYNLTITNNSGASPSDCERTGFTPSIIFSSTATVSHNYTITTPSVRVQYLSTNTYTFTNVNWNGQSPDTAVVFRNSATSGTWKPTITGTMNIANLNVSRADASAGALVTTQGTGDSGCNNTNWNLYAANAPTTLTQTSQSVPILTGNWVATTDITFTAQSSDSDPLDSLALCIEAEPIGTAFTGTTSCGSTVAYSGTPLTLTQTITMAADTAYHWQATVKDRGALYSSFATYGSNAETENDFGVDQSAPTLPTALTSPSHALSTWSKTKEIIANWSPAVDSGSGLSGYSYVFDTNATTVPAATQNLGSVTTITSAALSDGNSYYFHIRAVDALGHWTTTVHFGPFFIDATPPTFPAAPTAISPTENTSPTWSWAAATDSGSGIASYTVELSETATFISVETTPLTSAATSFTPSVPLSLGTWYVRVTAADIAGNTVVSPSSEGVVIEAPAPPASTPTPSPTVSPTPTPRPTTKPSASPSSTTTVSPTSSPSAPSSVTANPTTQATPTPTGSPTSSASTSPQLNTSSSTKWAWVVASLIVLYALGSIIWLYKRKRQ